MGVWGWRCALLLATVLGPAIATAAAQADVPAREVEVGAERFERGTPVPAWVDAIDRLPSTTDNGTPVVSLLGDVQLSVGDAASYEHRAWRINSSSGLSDVGQPGIEFNPSYQRVHLHRLRVHRDGRAMDRLATTRIHFLQRESGLERGVYSGEVEISLVVDDLRVGDTLEIAYTVWGSNPVFQGRFSATTNWDSSHRTELRRISMLSPANRKVRWALLGDAASALPAPSEERLGSQVRLRWEERGLPATSIEAGVPRDALPFRFLQFSEWRDWQEVADWAQGLFDTGPTPPAVVAIARNLGTGKTPNERAAAALAWVQDEIRYVSLSFGESSHRPAAPELTLQRRYGDCKDKSLMLVTLLRELGIQADPVLLSAVTPTRLSARLPSPSAFDHAIVRAQVDGRAYYLDPTREGQRSPLAAIGQPWIGAEVLVVQPGTAALSKVELVPGTTRTRDEVSERIVIDRLGGAGHLEHRDRVTGLLAERWRTAFKPLSPDVLGRAVLAQFAERYPGVTLSKPPLYEDDPQANVGTLRVELDIPDVAPERMGGWLVNFRAENITGVLRTGVAGSRRQPLALSEPRSLLYTVDLEFPPAVQRSADPGLLVVRDPSFTWSQLVAFRGNHATSRIELELLADRVEADKVVAYQDNVRKTERVPAAFLIHRIDLVRGNEPAASTLEKRVVVRYEDLARRITLAIDSGRLASDDLLMAYCERSGAYSVLNRKEQAMADALAARNLAPNDPHATRCVGTAYFSRDDFPQAMREFSAAIRLDPEARVSYRLRGQVRYFLGQYAQAADDMARAVMEGTGNEEGALLYSELWRLLAQKRAGVAPAPDQAKLIDRLPALWPRPAVDLFLGRSSVEQMLATIESKQGDERSLALAEGYFYAGEWYLAQGDDTRAAEYFRKTRELGAIHFLEHHAAQIELSRLQGGR